MRKHYRMTTQSPDSSYHAPALAAEVMLGLMLRPGDHSIDATLGDGGHALSILEATAPAGRLLAIDADGQALQRAQKRLLSFANRALLVNGNFKDLTKIAVENQHQCVAGILFDLGLSSWQLTGSGRGFSFNEDAPLDMRLGVGQVKTAADVVNLYGLEELANVIQNYGEEPRARRIAQAIVWRRPIRTSAQLAQIVGGAASGNGKRKKTHPATRTFQAIRIAVNEDLGHLETALEQSLEVVRKSGRVVVISYHSLEDRIVKTFMRRESKNCICLPNIPECTCGHQARVKLITKKVVKPTAVEVRENPRIRSAKLRVCEVI